MANKYMIHLTREEHGHLEDCCLFLSTPDDRQNEIDELKAEGWEVNGLYSVRHISGTDILPSHIGIE